MTWQEMEFSTLVVFDGKLHVHEDFAAFLYTWHQQKINKNMQACVVFSFMG